MEFMAVGPANTTVGQRAALQKAACYDNFPAVLLQANNRLCPERTAGLARCTMAAILLNAGVVTKTFLLRWP